jgi:hypothetical protein
MAAAELTLRPGGAMIAHSSRFGTSSHGHGVAFHRPPAARLHRARLFPCLYLGPARHPAGGGASRHVGAERDHIRGDLFGDRAITEGSALIDLDAPQRAEDAALVPIDMRIHAPASSRPSRR